MSASTPSAPMPPHPDARRHEFLARLPLAGAIAGSSALLLALPALRVSGPYLAMVTIAFAFIVQHGTIEWRTLTGGQNGLMGIVPPGSAQCRLPSARWRCSRPCWPASRCSFSSTGRERLGQGNGGGARLRDRRTLDRAQSGLDQDRRVCALGAVRGTCRRVFAPLMMFVAPEFVPVLAVDPVPARGDRRRRGMGARPGGRRGRHRVLPELLAGLAEYRLLFFGALLLVVLWLAPDGVIGTLARVLRRTERPRAKADDFDLAAFSAGGATGPDLSVHDIGICVRRHQGRGRCELHRAEPARSPA